jgi:NAD(P)-dependent dehydrogenase (short-subunit alcohol dehydrogenase family)
MTKNLQTVFISGANRGIGYELSLQLSRQSYQVIAGYRDSGRSEQLHKMSGKIDNLIPFKVDVILEENLKKLAGFISDQFGYLDVLVNNAGINIKRIRAMNVLNWSDLSNHINVNVGGVFLTTKYLYPLLQKGKAKKIINISSKLGSIKPNSGGSIPYCLSKASLNMLTKQQANEYRSDGICTISVSPGWVQTDMGGRSAPLSVEQSSTQMIKLIKKVSLPQSGQFLDLDGNQLPY